jgi:hypothetical protein
VADRQRRFDAFYRLLTWIGLSFHRRSARPNARFDSPDYCRLFRISVRFFSAIPAILLALSLARQRFICSRFVCRSSNHRIEHRDAADRTPNGRAAAGFNRRFATRLAVFVGAVGLILATPILAVVMVFGADDLHSGYFGRRTENLPEDVPQGSEESSTGRKALSDRTNIGAAKIESQILYQHVFGDSDAPKNVRMAKTRCSRI